LLPIVDDVLATKTIAEAMDWTANATEPYTPAEFDDEIHGISDGAKVPYQLLLRIHQLPEATKGHCSMFGAWGSAVPADSGVLQLRALDWDTSGPFKVKFS